jgi:hypothetical protein
MDDEKLGRREFLKLTIASTAAAGLSHFQFLNLGANVALAQDECDPAIPNSDICDAENPDICDPGNQNNPDICPDPHVASSDVCMPPDDEDECISQMGEPDICHEMEGDTCTDTNPDICELDQSPDVCRPPDDPDICPDGIGGDGDICNPLDPQGGSPDECIPGGTGDICVGPPDPELPPPTAVEMATFSAGWERQGVVVGWETASELDSLGFNLYRSLAARSGYQQINTSLIPCQAPGTPQGAAYSFLDSQVQPNTVYYYVIETMDTQGRADRYGPVVANPLRRLLPTRRRPVAGGPSLEGQ